MPAEGSRAAAIIVAGGVGSRFGESGGKQLAMLAGVPVLAHTVRAFGRAGTIGLIVVVCPAERTEQYRSVAVTPFTFTTETVFAPSGPERTDSVRSGLLLVPEKFEVVVVHDGARPLVTPRFIDTCVEALGADPDVDGVVAGLPSYDTLKEVSSGRIVRTVDRSNVWAVQTPQAFRRQALVTAYERALREGVTATDDAAIIEAAGGVVALLEGPRDNIKVTVAEDIEFAEAIVARRENG